MKLDVLTPRFCTCVSVGLGEPEPKQYGNEEEKSDIKDVKEAEFKELMTGDKWKDKERESIG